MTSYTPTGGDGRYARIYLTDLEPRREEGVLESPPPSFEALALALDQALTAGDRVGAAAQIRLLRVRARGLAPYWEQEGGAPAPPGPACRNHPTSPATHTAVMPAQAKQPDGSYDEHVPLCPTCAVRIGTIGFPVEQR
ncbi:hypothetical protein [Parafrankia sp. FMc2]|uniref:hypothetical protein n=1 Tax=Parafrankia sp. FMc2 TaxID=3233196 RepID=UPI0034D43837